MNDELDILEWSRELFVVTVLTLLALASAYFAAAVLAAVFH